MRIRVNPATAIALIALFVALGGPAQAKKLITGSSIRPNTITTRQVRPASLLRTDLTAGTIRFLRRTPDRAIRSNQIATRAVTAENIPRARVGTTAVAEKTLRAAEVAPGALTRGVLGADSVGFDELANNTVGKANLRLAAVGKSELAGSAVGMEEIGASLAGVTFPEIAASACQSVDQPLALPAGADLAKTFILVGQPSTWPGGRVTLSGRAQDDGDPNTPSTTLRLTACNLGSSAVTPGQQVIPYVAMVP